MFVFLSKFLPPLIYPLGLAILLGICALLLRKHPKIRGAAGIGALLILLLASNRWVAVSLARTLEWQYIPGGEIPSAEVIVLLGGGTEPAYAPRPQVEVNGAGDRILYTAALYKSGKASAILVSGGNITWLDSRVSTPASDMRDLLQLTGVPPDRVWLEDKSQNTYENALYSAAILKEKHLTRVILVTSAMHMPRSVALFHAQGIEVFPAPSDFTVTQSGWAELGASPTAVLVNILPSASSLSLTTSVLKEYIGMMVYRLNGWL